MFYEICQLGPGRRLGPAACQWSVRDLGRSSIDKLGACGSRVVVLVGFLSGHLLRALMGSPPQPSGHKMPRRKLYSIIWTCPPLVLRSTLDAGTYLFDAGTPPTSSLYCALRLYSFAGTFGNSLPRTRVKAAPARVRASRARASAPAKRAQVR